jgi:hypothetical protein
MKLTNDLRKQIQDHLYSGETLVIPGQLTLEDEDLGALPFMRVKGDLALKSMTRLTRLWGLQVGGHLVIDDCDFLEELPKQCVVGKGVVLKHNTLLSNLGDNLSCKYLYVESCPSMSTLELGIERCQEVTIKHCHNLEIVTQQRLAWAPSEVTFDDCGLISLPTGLKASTTLKVTGCNKLKTAGAEVFNAGDLYYVSKGRIQRVYDPKDGNQERLPKSCEAGIMMVRGWHEIRGISQSHQN